MKRFGMMMSLVLACSSQAALAKNLNVVASFTVLADMAKQVGGEHVTVKSLVGPNGDPHSFEPSPQDSVALSKADVVIVSGLGMEGWMDRLVSASGYKGKVIVATEGISSRSMVEDGKQITDPHAWNSAENGAIYAQNITKALMAADPQDATAISKINPRPSPSLVPTFRLSMRCTKPIPITIFPQRPCLKRDAFVKGLSE